MGSMNNSSCRWCMFVSCVHPVAVFNAELCMNDNLTAHQSFRRLYQCQSNIIFNILEYDHEV